MAPGDQWRQEDESLVRDLEFDGFKAATAFVNRVAEPAETIDGIV